MTLSTIDSTSRLRLIVGLGNPGSAYDGTPHNLGYATIDELARRHGLGPWAIAGATLVCAWPSVPGEHGPALLVKPQLGMNASGRALRPLLAEHVRALGDVLVVVDDVSLPAGALQTREGGGCRGHNGLRDLEASIGRGWHRLSLGIGPAPEDGLGFVVERIPDGRRATSDTMVGNAADCTERWCAWGIGVAERLADALRRAVGQPP